MQKRLSGDIFLFGDKWARSAAVKRIRGSEEILPQLLYLHKCRDLVYAWLGLCRLGKVQTRAREGACTV